MRRHADKFPPARAHGPLGIAGYTRNAATQYTSQHSTDIQGARRTGPGGEGCARAPDLGDVKVGEHPALPLGVHQDVGGLDVAVQHDLARADLDAVHVAQAPQRVAEHLEDEPLRRRGVGLRDPLLQRAAAAVLQLEVDDRTTRVLVAADAQGGDHVGVREESEGLDLALQLLLVEAVAL